jgi:hypothetical protein
MGFPSKVWLTSGAMVEGLIGGWTVIDGRLEIIDDRSQRVGTFAAGQWTYIERTDLVGTAPPTAPTSPSVCWLPGDHNTHVHLRPWRDADTGETHDPNLVTP